MIRDAAPSALGRLASELMRERRARVASFQPVAEALREPAWDILLALFVAHEVAKPIQVTSLALDAGVAMTTALRWIAFLEDKGLVESCGSPTDGRARLTAITPDGLQRMENYLEAVRSSATRYSGGSASMA